jgi:hypothetical protein
MIRGVEIYNQNLNIKYDQNFCSLLLKKSTLTFDNFLKSFHIFIKFIYFNSSYHGLSSDIFLQKKSKQNFLLNFQKKTKSHHSSRGGHEIGTLQSNQ